MHLNIKETRPPQRISNREQNPASECMENRTNSVNEPHQQSEIQPSKLRHCISIKPTSSTIGCQIQPLLRPSCSAARHGWYDQLPPAALAKQVSWQHTLANLLGIAKCDSRYRTVACPCKRLRSNGVCEVLLLRRNGLLVALGLWQILRQFEAVIAAPWLQTIS